MKTKKTPTIREPVSFTASLPATTHTMLDAHGGMWGGTWEVETGRATRLVLTDDSVEITDARTGNVLLRMRKVKTER